MTEEESIKEREFRLYEYLRHAAQEANQASIPPIGIARIVNRTGPAITNARIRLHKKIHKTEGSSEKFDESIKNL